MKNVLKLGSERDWKLAEAAIAGSFDEIRNKVNSAIKASGWFPEKDDKDKYIDTPYIRTMFPDKAIVNYNGYLYQVGYSILDKAVTLSQPKMVEETYVIKESMETELKEAKIQKISEARDEELEVSNFISLKEAKWNEDLGEVEVVLIEAGTNPVKRRHYPVQTIKEAAAGFRGLKMYINHPTPKEEKERPERDLKEWASTIVESRFEDNKAVAKVAIHDTWLRERLKDPVAREHIGLSINTGGKVSIGKIDGKQMQIVEKIVFARKNGPVSVDWVTEPGARGRVSRLLESRTEDIEMLENVTLKELKESRTDLVNAILKESLEPVQKELKETQAKLKDAEVKIAEFEKGSKLSKQSELVEASLKESKAPDAVKEKVREHFKTNLVEGSEADLKESIGKVLKRELEYANRLSGKGKINFSGEGDSGDLKESFQNMLDERAGVREAKKD